MQHIHGPNCGCKQFAGVENANDLYSVIDIAKVICFNEEQKGTCKGVFKEYQDRFDKIKYVASNDGAELLVIIPFISIVKIRSICVISKDQVNYPTKMRIYINQENVDFSLIEVPPIEQFPLNSNQNGLIHHAVKSSKYSRVSRLILHLLNANLQKIEVSYIQIKGQNTNLKRQPVSAVYEVKPVAEKKDIEENLKNSYQMQ